MLLPYNIDYTDQQDKDSFQIQPGQINRDTSLTLPGKGRVDYGEFYNENLVHLLENFSNSAPPINPTKGQLWYESTNNTLKVYNGGEWLTLLSTTLIDRFRIPTVSVLPTADLNSGDIVFYSVDQKLYIYADGNWRDLATEFWAENTLDIDGGEVGFV